MQEENDSFKMKHEEDAQEDGEHGHDGEGITTKGRRPPKKRSSQQDQGGRSSPQERKKVPLDQKRLEARRRSNRMSARKARLRTKLTIRMLEEGQAELRAANEALYVQLEEALLQNQALRRMMEEEHQEALASNLALQRMLEHRIAARRSHEVPYELPTTTSPPSMESDVHLLSTESTVPSQHRPSYSSSGTENENDATIISPSSNSSGLEMMDADKKIEHIHQEIKSLRESIRIHPC
jgi:hypothetical protein